MSNNKFLKGAAILGVSGVIVKLIGAVFRIPLTNWIGEDGMAFYGCAYPIYSFFLVISTAGIPVAISKMVSERITVRNYSDAHKVFQVSLRLLTVLGVVSFLLCYLGADMIAGKFQHIPEAASSIRAISPALLFVPVLSAFRGYFQGRQNMNPTAISELTEQTFRAIVGLSLAYSFMTVGLSEAAAGATFGASAGSFAGMVIIMLIYGLNRKTIHTKIRRGERGYENSRDILKKILIIAIPITLGAAIMPIMSTIDSIIVPGRLMDTGWTKEQAQSLFGQLSGYCSSLIGLPQIFTQAVAVSLVPAISAAFLRGDRNELQDNVRLGLRATMIIGFPCAVGLFVMAEPIMLLLFPRQEAEAVAAAPTLMVMAIGVVFLASVQTLTGALQGVGRQSIPVRNLAIGAVVKLVVSWICVGIPTINVKGAALGSIAAYGIAMVLDLAAVRRFTGTKFDMKLTYIIPGVASGLMGAAAFAAYKGLFMITDSNGLSALAAIGIAVIVYAALILLMRGITKDEISRLPKGDKLVRLLGRFVK
ncbi:MAG: polysaccharide biosynthesis protein [Firmicutes bacterium]|nr:polysaccharide biosynthesis protein [Bacillota bacterium]